MNINETILALSNVGEFFTWMEEGDVTDSGAVFEFYRRLRAARKEWDRAYDLLDEVRTGVWDMAARVHDLEVQVENLADKVNLTGGPALASQILHEDEGRHLDGVSPEGRLALVLRALTAMESGADTEALPVLLKGGIR